MPSSPSIGKEYKKYILHGWINKKVSDICLLGRGRVISEIEIIEHSGVYPVYSSQSTNHGEMGRINTYDFDGEYVTWTTDGAYAGSVFYRQGRFNCTNVCGTLKLKDPKYSHRFLAYLLSTHTKKYVSYVGNPKLMNGVVAQIELNIPSSPDEQSKIAEILSTIDEAIEKTDQLIEKYKSIKQGLMEDFFRYGIDENGQIRSEKTHKFKDSQLGRIPLEWEVANFTRILIPQKDAIKIGPFGSQLKKEYLTETGYRVYGQENAFLKTFDIGERFISKDRFKLLKSCELLPGDFIISMMGTIGKCAIIPEGIKAGIMDSHLIRIRIDESKCDKKLLFYLLEEYPLIKNQIIALSVGGIMQGLSSRIIRSLFLPLLPKDEQSRIKTILEATDRNIETQEVNKRKLKDIKQGLMDDLLSGRVRVTKLLN